MSRKDPAKRTSVDVKVGSDIRKPEAKLGLALGTILFFLIATAGVAVHATWLLGVAAAVFVGAWMLTPNKKKKEEEE
jgi:hypothetical protein